jgi:sporulation protein YlmC with PRC-barrel domain
MVLRLLHDIQGMQVVSLAEGRALGTVQKVFLDPARQTVSGLVVRGAGLTGGESWIPIQEVDRVGEDVVFASRAAACQPRRPSGRSLKELMGMPVATRDGKLLGSLIDVEIDEAWRVTELILSEGRWVALAPDSALVGPDTILLPASTLAMERARPQGAGGLLAWLFGVRVVDEVVLLFEWVGRIIWPGCVRSTRCKKPPRDGA